MSETKTVSVVSCSASNLLGIAFVILKLCNVITWPWLYVLLPFLIPLFIVVTILICLALGLLVLLIKK